MRPTWAEVNMDNLLYNLSEIKKKISTKVKIMAVVKADAYGHGSVEVAKLLSEMVDYFAVAILDEAIELRKEGIKNPILVLGYTPFDGFADILRYDISQTVFDLEYAKKLSEEAEKWNKEVKIHIKIDTGMGRIGYTDYEKAINEIKEIKKFPNIIVEGIYTHFATADDKNKEYANMQYEKFLGILRLLEKQGVYIPLKHAANSAAILDLPYTHFDMVRAGLILYGLYPSEYVNRDVNLKPVMSFKTKVVYVKELLPGESVSYGRKFIATKKTKVATLPVGYADGFTRMLSGKAKVIVKGKYAPVIGNICMDQCMIDVTEIEDVKVGDVVTLLGCDGDIKISAEHWAELLGTINYEVVCLLKKRVPRIYIKDGKVYKVENGLIR